MSRELMRKYTQPPTVTTYVGLNSHGTMGTMPCTPNLFFWSPNWETHICTPKIAAHILKRKRRGSEGNYNTKSRANFSTWDHINMQSCMIKSCYKKLTFFLRVIKSSLDIKSHDGQGCRSADLNSKDQGIRPSWFWADLWLVSPPFSL